MSLLRRPSVPVARPADDDDQDAANGRSTGTDEGGYLTQRQREEDIVKWQEDMVSPLQAPGFRGLWQSQGRVLMLFALTLAALVVYVSLVS